MLDKPEEPDPSDCCNSGCTTCVFDIYRKQLEEWKQSKRMKRSHNVRSDLLSQTRFKPFRLIKKISLAENFFILRFQPETGITNNHIVNSCGIDAADSMLDIPGVLPYSVGQHLVLRSYPCNKSSTNVVQDLANSDIQHCTVHDQITANREEFCSCKSEDMIVRSYTPITVASKIQNCYFDILVKIYEHGPMSKIFKCLRIGNTVDFRGPNGNFFYNENMYSNILMICMGTGIAPMYPIAKSVVENEVDETVVHLLYGVRNVSEILLRDELRKLTEFWNFTETICLSQEKSTMCSKFGENFVYKKINKELIEKKIIGKNLETFSVLICGSDMFCESILNFVVQCNVSESNIHIF